MVWEHLYRSLSPLFSRKARNDRPRSVEACKRLQSLSPRLSLPEVQPAPRAGRPWEPVFHSRSVNGPHWPCLGSHTPSVVLPPPSLQSVLLNIGWGRGLTEIASLWSPLTARAPPSLYSVSWGVGGIRLALKSTSRNQPAAWKGRGSEGGCDRQRPQGQWVPQVPAGGWADSSALVAAPPPELGREGGARTKGLSAPGPAPPWETHSIPSSPCTRAVWAPPAARAPPALTGLPRPRPLQQPLRGPHVLRLHCLHQLLLLPHGAAGPAATRRSVLSAAQTQRRLRVCDRILSSPRSLRRPPSSALRGFGLGLGLGLGLGFRARTGAGAPTRRDG